eukprot:scaffold655_cov379-Prasinococcus_capsulatus_cf.AAC.14
MSQERQQELARFRSESLASNQLIALYIASCNHSAASSLLPADGSLGQNPAATDVSLVSPGPTRSRQIVCTTRPVPIMIPNCRVGVLSASSNAAASAP